MRNDTEAFASFNKSPYKEPRYVALISFDADNTDTHYFTSHGDITLPGGSQVTHGVLKMVAGTSQRLRPEQALSSIGNIESQVVDKDNAVRDLLATKLGFGKSPRGLRYRVYAGWKGLDWDDYSIIATQTVQSMQYRNGTYTVICNDIQRAARKDIFTLASTTLSASIDESQLLIPVTAVTGFSMVAHGTSYADAASSTVGYFWIDDELIRWTGTTTDGTLGLCFVADQRGALNTRAAEHNVDPNASNDRKKQVQEYVYLEMPVPKLIYALLTGEIYGQGGATLPEHWHLGIDTEMINLNDFTGIGPDLWDTTNDAAGFVARFEGLEKTDGKRFIEQQLLYLITCFTRIYNDGRLGIQRMTRVTRDAAYVRELNTDNIYSYSDLTHDLESVVNNIIIHWNWDPLSERYTRTDELVDNSSITIYGRSAPIEISFRGLSGSRHSLRVLESHFNGLRDRFSGEPLRLDLVLLPSQNDIEVGDIVRVKLEHVEDYVVGTTLDRSFEVQEVSIDWRTGRVRVSLFASSRLADEIDTSVQITVLPDAWYGERGTEISAYIAANYPGNFSLIGDVGHITGDVTLPGDANANGDNAIYYYLGDLEIDSGVTVTITQNVQLRVMGVLTVNGLIDGAGQGIAAGNTGGFIGVTKSGGGIELTEITGGPAGRATLIEYSTDGQINAGTVTTSPVIALDNTGSDLLGLPADLRGVAGLVGGHLVRNGNYEFSLNSGGAGGAGLVTIARGAVIGPGGEIDVSGANGGYVIRYNDFNYNIYWYAGHGGPGHPGAVYFFMDGAGAVTPLLSRVVAMHGSVPGFSPVIPSTPGIWGPIVNGVQPWSHVHSYYVGIIGGDRREAVTRVQFIPEHEDAEQDPDVGVIAAPTGLAVYSGTGEMLTEQDGTVIVRARLTWTASPDPRTVGYVAQYRRTVDSIWFSGGEILGRGNTEMYINNLQSGVAYDFRVAAGDGLRNISTWNTIFNHTVVGKAAAPSDVPAFNVYQNGAVAIMRWTGIADADLQGYEIRYAPQGAAVWADAVPLTRATRGTNVTTADIPDGEWTMLIKAVDTSGNYSTNATSADIDFVSDYDIITQRPQAPAWLGTVTGFVRHWTGKLLVADQNTANTYTNFELFDQYVPTPVAVCEYEAPEIDIDFDDDARCWGDITSVLGPGEVAGVANPQLQLDHRTAAGAYDGYESWSVGIATGRYFKFKIRLDTSEGLPVISAFKPTVDNVEFTQRASNVAVSAAGETIAFPISYHIAPYVDVAVLGTGALYAVIESISTDQFVVHIFNSSGTEVGGNINWTAVGV